MIRHNFKVRDGKMNPDFTKKMNYATRMPLFHTPDSCGHGFPRMPSWAYELIEINHRKHVLLAVVDDSYA